MFFFMQCSNSGTAIFFIFTVFLFRHRFIFFSRCSLFRHRVSFFYFFSLDAKRYLKDLFGNWHTKIELINHFSLPALLIFTGLACKGAMCD